MTTTSIQSWRQIIIVFIITKFCLCSYADEKQNPVFEFEHNRVAFSWAFTNSYYVQGDLSYHYMLNKFIGLGASLGYWKVVYPDVYPEGNGWYVDSDSYDIANLFLRPSLILKTPPLKIKKCEIGLFVQPGAMMNIPYVNAYVLQNKASAGYSRKSISTTRGQWLAIDAKLGLFLNLGPCGFSAGYLISDHDIYGQYRHLSYNGVSFNRFYPEKTLQHGIYVMASYYF